MLANIPEHAVDNEHEALHTSRPMDCGGVCHSGKRAKEKENGPEGPLVGFTVRAARWLPVQ